MLLIYQWEHPHQSGNNIYSIYGIPIASDFEGAGVVNAGACYNMSNRQCYENYTLTSTGIISKGITISDTTKPLRVAIAWRTEMKSEEEFNNSNIMLHVYKDGSAQAVSRSAGLGYLQSAVQNQEGPVVNYQYLEIPESTLAAKGAGNYTIKMIFNSTQNNIVSVPLSLAWSQYVNPDT